VPGPLSHIRVLDLSRVLAGPWAGQLLSDLGADVIKVERPGAGDDTRSWGPPFLKDRDGGETQEAAYFLAVNRGKRSITADLATQPGQRIVRALAARSDILLENYKAGTLAKFGLSYDDLKKVKPDIIYCSITGFGQTGPRRDNAAYDFMIQAMSGLMSVTGERDDRLGGGPQKVGIPIVDIMTGMYGAVAVLAALARRYETGRGDHIDIGMLDVAVASLANQAMNYLTTGKVPKRWGNRHPNIQPQDVYPTRDGHIALAVGNDSQFVKFCDVIGRPDLAVDERFAANASRIRNLEVLSPVIAQIMAQRDTKSWADVFDKAGIPCGPINTIADAFDDPQLIHRGMRIEIGHASAGEISMVANPIRFAEAELSYASAPPLLGQHNEEILSELILDDSSSSAEPSMTKSEESSGVDRR
jgi:crotonobetainyl-CoA:carnitine CoA-transferase CaiB-like acyl-CoA transferase